METLIPTETAELYAIEIYYLTMLCGLTEEQAQEKLGDTHVRSGTLLEVVAELGEELGRDACFEELSSFREFTYNGLPFVCTTAE